MHTLIQLIKKCPPLLAVIQWLLRTAEQIHQLYLKLCWQIFVRLPLKERKVIFCNFYGGGFGDNPKFIAEEMIRRNLGFEMYWVCAHPEMVFPAPIRSVKPNSTAFAYHMATAKFLVENTRRQYYFIKRPGQFYIQTWHGGPGLKKVEMDVQAALSDEYIAYAKRDSACIDLPPGVLVQRPHSGAGHSQERPVFHRSRRSPPEDRGILSHSRREKNRALRPHLPGQPGHRHVQSGL